MISSIVKRTLRLDTLGLKDFGVLHKDLNKATESVMSTTGEVSSLVYSEHLLDMIENQNDNDLLAFLKNLVLNFDVNTDILIKDTRSYADEKNQKNYKKMTQSSEPRWLELFKRLNATSDGTSRLVKLRERIGVLRKNNSEIEALDTGLLDLFKYWFNPSFLVLEKIDWSSPANVLEKIIAYEAVHEINSWDDLRARLAPNDRQCFAFFHPLIPEEPLIFVEVALCNSIPSSIQEVIKIERDEINAEEANTAVFYSISNCQNGLSGISFGNFLIKKVAHKLKMEMPKLDVFVTLSPIPGFMSWLENKAPMSYERCIDGIDIEEDLMKKAITYLTESDREDKKPNDAVARFHLGNGAILQQINLNADLSKKGKDQSNGLMANYLYDLDVVEKNHELFFKTKIVQISDEIKSLKKKYS
tara:strand:- start:53 stop:1300 length:1248 start_codon:yes stop_codon:yes gene_type:complete